MAATRRMITREEAEHLEVLVRVARFATELTRGYVREICDLAGADSCDFVEDVVYREQPLAWMLERLGIEVEAAAQPMEAAQI